MPSIESTAHSLGTLDTLAYQDSWVHRLDPRAKLLTTLIFIIIVASFDKYAVSALLPFFCFPVGLLIASRLPARPILYRLLLAAPFALMIGAWNPVIDQVPVQLVGDWSLNGGWFSFLSILLRFSLAVTATLILIATSSFPGICMALSRLGAPRVFTVQLLLLYRYLFVLLEETLRLVRARTVRSVNPKRLDIRLFSQMAGQLLIRSLERSQRVHRAMLSRGFDGKLRSHRAWAIGYRGWAYMLGWAALFVVLRLYNVPQLLGSLLLR